MTEICYIYHCKIKRKYRMCVAWWSSNYRLNLKQHEYTCTAKMYNSNTHLYTIGVQSVLIIIILWVELFYSYQLIKSHKFAILYAVFMHLYKARK